MAADMPRDVRNHLGWIRAIQTAVTIIEADDLANPKR